MISTKKENHLHWIWISMGVILVILGSLLFTLYGRSLGPLSHEHAAWSSFGSLLAGFFTLTGTVATIATLLFLNKQNQEQQKVTRAQISAMIFEQYINHRKLFMDRLVELQTTFENQLTFLNGEKLYTEIFRNNRPTNVEFVVKPTQTDGTENLISSLGSQIAQLDQMLGKSQWQDEEIIELVILLISLHGSLHCRWEAAPFDGDIFYCGKNTGINIYSIEEFLHRAKAIYNSLLFYTGNDFFSGFDKGSSRYVREALIKFFIGSHRLGREVVVRKTILGLEIMEGLLFSIDMLRETDNNWIMPRTYRKLESAFENRESVANLSTDSFIRELVSVGYQEGSAGFLKSDEASKSRSDLTHCIDEITKLRALKKY